MTCINTPTLDTVLTFTKETWKPKNHSKAKKMISKEHYMQSLVTKAEATWIKHVSIALCSHPTKVGYRSESVQMYLDSTPCSGIHFDISDGNRTHKAYYMVCVENQMDNDLFNNYHDNLTTSGWKWHLEVMPAKLYLSTQVVLYRL